ncbi:MAG: YigZ family protein [Firmicutes bacterium]|nr:YigZ family protein [Bacillota bacterium]
MGQQKQTVMVIKMTEAESTYLSPRRALRRSFSEQGSRFIVDLAPARSQEAAKDFIDKIRAEFSDATHHTYAFRIGAGSAIIEQASDDREPAGTAGAPILQYLQGHRISDAVLVVTRYFGGTKLGIGGLTRAYRSCARVACEASCLDLKEPLINYALQFKYGELGSVTRLANSHGGRVLAVDYGDTVVLNLELPLRSSASFKERFEAICRGGGELELY